MKKGKYRKILQFLSCNLDIYDGVSYAPTTILNYPIDTPFSPISPRCGDKIAQRCGDTSLDLAPGHGHSHF